MTARNLADPDFEPTDADLQGLSVRAFAHVRAANESALRKLRADISTAREKALRNLAVLRATGRGAV